MSTKARLAALVAAALTTVALPGVALAGSASTPVGQLTSVQHHCDEPGAYVLLTVTGGFPNKLYSAITNYDQTSFNTVPATFTTNASGAASAIVPYGGYHGTWSITVTANGQSGVVTHEANCDDGWGD